MAFISTIFALIVFFSLPFILIGLIKPSLFKMNSRKKVLITGGTAFVISFIGVGITAPDQPEQTLATEANALSKEEANKEREEEAKKKDLEEQKKKEEAEKTKALEAEKAKELAEQKKMEEEKAKQEAEQKRLEAEQKAKELAERQRLEEEERQRKLAEEEATRKKAEEEAAARAKAEEEAKAKAAATPPPAPKESFQNCTELRKVYPNGVGSDHPAYAPKHDRDKDGWACER